MDTEEKSFDITVENALFTSLIITAQQKNNAFHSHKKNSSEITNKRTKPIIP